MDPAVGKLGDVESSLIPSSATGDEVHSPALRSDAPHEVAELAEDPGGSSTLGKRPRDDTTIDESMDCSRASNGFTAKRQQSLSLCQDVLLCLPLEVDSAHVTPQQLTQELARCLHESKYMLVKSAVDVLGSERCIELFTKTAETQKQGGLLSADGDKKRAPGGIFFSLIKSSATEEEKKQIFFKDKTRAARRAKKIKEDKGKRRKRREEEEERKRQVLEGAQRELEIFRQDLGLGGGEERQHPPDRNMEQRGKRGRVVGYTDLDNPVSPEESGELNKGWRNEFDDDGDCGNFTLQLSRYQQLKRDEPRSKEEGELCDENTVVGGGAALLETEKVAADQFEKTDVCSLGIDITCDF